ncbi:MAG: hypothetical protein Q9195_004165 [Heterodermia aff. obscurata]
MLRADASLTVTPCGDGSYCCGNKTVASTCCDNNNGLFIDPSTGDAIQNDPSATSSTLVPTVIASVTVTAVPSKKKSNNAGVIAGSVMAVVVVLAAGGVGAWIVLRKRRKMGDAGFQGRGLGKAGMKYSEMPDSELESMDGRREVMDGRGEVRDERRETANGRRVATDTRVPENVELDSRQRHEMQDDHIPVVRHELGT